MPNRTLKESICTSKRFNRLPEATCMLYMRLIVNCDDYGRAYGEPEVIRARCYPYGNATQAEVVARLSELVESGMVRLYQYDGTQYLALTAWMEHNRPRAVRSKYPDPDGDGVDLQTSASICMQMPTDAAEHEHEHEHEHEVEEREQPSPIEEEISNLKSWGELTQADREWIGQWTSDYPTVLISDIRGCRDWWLEKTDKQTKGQWKVRLRNWMNRKCQFDSNGRTHGTGQPGNTPSGAFDDIET